MAFNINSFIQDAKNNFLFLKDRITKKQINTVINHVTVRPTVRQTQDIQRWRLALMSAEQDHDQRSTLYDLYNEIMLDGRLKALVAQRVSRITNTRISFTIDGKPVEEIEAITNKKFFIDFIRWSFESRFWGYSLSELYWPAPGDTIGWTNMIPRKHVKPRLGIVTKNAHDITGIKYQDQPFATNCIAVGNPIDLGLILEVCPFVIYKRGAFGDWAEYAEVFGMPFRWATYSNEPSRVVLEEALSKAGSAGYVVAPEDAKLQFFSPPGGTSNDLFKILKDACNEEIAVSILGNTMTTQEAKHSGYAQSKTHRQTQDELHDDDRSFVLTILNENLTPYLASLGYKVDGGAFKFVDGDGLTLNERLEIDLKVSDKVPIADNYWYEKYNLPKPEPGEIPTPTGKEKSKGGLQGKKNQAVK